MLFMNVKTCMDSVYENLSVGMLKVGSGNTGLEPRIEFLQGTHYDPLGHAAGQSVNESLRPYKLPCDGRGTR